MPCSQNLSDLMPPWNTTPLLRTLQYVGELNQRGGQFPIIIRFLTIRCARALYTLNDLVSSRHLYTCGPVCQKVGDLNQRFGQGPIIRWFLTIYCARA